MTVPKLPLKVFLSYASQDKLLVRELSRRLMEENWINTWQDEKNLLPGQDWRLNILDAVDTSDIVIICLSNSSVNKEGYVQKELRYAQEIALEKPEGTTFLIPLRLEECEVPRGLRFYQWVDYFDDRKDDSYKALVASLKLRYEQKIKAEENRLRGEKRQREAVVPEKAEQEEKQRNAREEAKREDAERKQKEKERLKTSERDMSAGFGGNEIKQGIWETIKDIKPVYRFVVFVIIVISGIAFYTSLNRPSQLPKATPPIAETFTATFEPSETSKPDTTPTSQVTPSPTMGVGSTMTGVDGMTLLYVPAGNFKMGSSERSQLTDLSSNNYPQYDYYLDSFWVDQTEVTNQQYAMCVSAGECQLPLVLNSPRRSSYYNDPKYDDFPVIYIEWGMARDYCEWAGRRLLTEAEWEKAARGTDSRIYPWGNDEPIHNYFLNYGTYWEDTSVVRSFSLGKSPYGVYDMAGNVWEWTSSLYMPYPYEADDGREDLTATDRHRVLRGGSWYFNPENNTMSMFRYGVITDPNYLVRADVRSFSYEDGRGPTSPEGLGIVGFRCAKDAP